jgi:glycosyltransferase involved in cell wall biosynthesis
LRLTVSVIIPTLNEATTLGVCLAERPGLGADEVIVADADSPDGKAGIAGRAGAIVVESPRGRDLQ